MPAKGDKADIILAVYFIRDAVLMILHINSKVKHFIYNSEWVHGIIWFNED